MEETDQTHESIRRQISPGSVSKDCYFEKKNWKNKTKNVLPVKRIILKRDSSEQYVETRGFGLKIKSTKAELDRTMHAYISRIVHDGPADKAGIETGDYVLELCGIPLINLCNEEIESIVNLVGGIMEIVIQSPELKLEESDMDFFSDFSKKTLNFMNSLKNRSTFDSKQLSKTLVHSKGKTMPTVTLKAVKDNQTCKIKLEFRCEERPTSLTVLIYGASNLPLKDHGTFMPKAIMVGFLPLPSLKNENIIFSQVAEPSLNPVWNTFVELQMSNHDTLRQHVQVMLCDRESGKERYIIGECVVQLNKSNINKPKWFTIQLNENLSQRKFINYSLESGTLRSFLVKSNSESKVKSSYSGPMKKYFSKQSKAIAQKWNKDEYYEKLGPFQLEMRQINSIKETNIVLSMELVIANDKLVIKINSAQGMIFNDKSIDVYVKTYLKDFDKLQMKQKTPVVIGSHFPVFNYTVKYPIKDTLQKSLTVMLWESRKGFELNRCLGIAEIRLDKLQVGENVHGWYPLLLSIYEEYDTRYTSPKFE